MVRCVLKLRPAPDLRACVVEHDVGLAARFVAALFAIMFHYFMLVRKAVGIALASTWCASGAQAAEMQGTWCSVDSLSHGDAGGPRRKYLAWVRHVRSLSLTWSNKVLAYRICLQCAASSLGNFVLPKDGVARAEARRSPCSHRGSDMHILEHGIADRPSARRRSFGRLSCLRGLRNSR